MFTRCPECHAIYPLRALWMAQNQGKVECGRCGKIYNCIEHLFDDWPEPDELPAPAATSEAPFYLSHRISNEKQAVHHLEAAGQIELPNNDTGIEGGTDSEIGTDPDQLDLLPFRTYKWVWNSLLLLLIPLTLINFGWHYRHDLLQNTTLRSTAEGLGLVKTANKQKQRHPEQFQLLSRDMHAHPGLKGALVLSLTIVNRAGFRQNLPDIEISLLDENQKTLARRRLKPAEYLAEKHQVNNGLAPDALLPLVIEFADPAVAARGYEIQFL